MDSDRFFNENFHMDKATFDMLYVRLEKHLRFKLNTRPNDRIPEKLRLAIVLEFLASGTLARHMSSIYRISKASFGHILDQVCDAIICEFKDEFMTFSNENWLKVANEFNYRWNLPNCVGAIDGKHVAIVCPRNSGSLFYNYKVRISILSIIVYFHSFDYILSSIDLQKFYSIVLMAISDANYKFLYVNVGAFGSEGDSGVFLGDAIGKKIYNDELTLPEDSMVGERELPFYFISDDAFTLSKRIMKPYTPTRQKSLSDEEKIFNYRLSRARRCVENSFGILTSKWLCLSQPLRQHPARASKIVLACCVLHNVLLGEKTYCPPNFADHYDERGNLIEGEWRTNRNNDLVPLQRTTGRIADRPKEIREILKTFVNSEAGSVPWQNESIH